MNFLGSDETTPITTWEEWERLGAPAQPKHWKPGRSSYEAMRDWLLGDAAVRAEALLRQVPGLEELALDEAVVEKKTAFDAFRGPRNHDLRVRGEADGAPVVVAVEAKADETFGETLADYVTKAQSKLDEGERTRARERADALSRAFLGASLDEDPDLKDVRYQLLSGLAGTLADAEAGGAATAVFLVHEFRTPATEPSIQ